MEKKDSPNIGHNKKSLLNSPVEHINIKSFDARKIIEGMGKMSFTSRDTARAAAIYNEMLADKDCSIFLTLAGSTSAGGCMDLYTDLVKQDKVTEITGLEQRIQAFQQNANEALISKEKELLEPILQKARQAIEDVANEGDYTYIFDKSVGSILYVKESENILEKVKKKLKL